MSESVVKIAVLVGEGVAVDRVDWPPRFDVRVYGHNLKDASRVAAMISQRHVDGVFVVSKRPNSNVLSMLPKNIIPVRVWNHSVATLANQLETLMPSRSDANANSDAAKFVTVKHASSQPARRPPWTDDERTALLMAYNGAVDFQKVIDTYLDLTSDIDAPVRSQAEIRTEIERLKSREDGSNAVGENDAVLCLLWEFRNVCEVAWSRERLDAHVDIMDRFYEHSRDLTRFAASIDGLTFGQRRLEALCVFRLKHSDSVEALIGRLTKMQRTEDGVEPILTENERRREIQVLEAELARLYKEGRSAIDTTKASPASMQALLDARSHAIEKGETALVQALNTKINAARRRS